MLKLEYDLKCCENDKRNEIELSKEGSESKHGESSYSQSYIDTVNEMPEGGLGD